VLFPTEKTGLPYRNDMFKLGDGETFRAQHAHVDLPLMENDEVLEAPVHQNTLTARYTQRAMRFIGDHRDLPFFLYLAHTFPHSPQYASNDFEGRSPHGYYADAVEELDWSTGRILDTVRQLGIGKHTMVVFTSDNGPAPGRRGEPRWMGGSAGPLRGGKGNTYEGGMRVPAIFWQPGTIPAGRTADAVASVMDILPTAAELAKANLPAGRTIDGRPITKVLTGESPAGGEERLFCYYFGGQLQAVRRGKWKLILRITELPERPASLWYQTMPELFARHYRLKTSPELYDLAADVRESSNLADRHPDIVKDLTRAAERFDAQLQADKQPAASLD
jgi:arylsulfatase A-like enzyme